jgi:hypothetical protein
MNEVRKWIDLTEHGIFLGDQRMADGVQRLVLLDMQDRGNTDKLSNIGFLPVVGSPHYENGIYYLHSDDQRLRARQLAAAFGIEKYSIVEMESAEIERVFREKITEKFGANINAVIKRSRHLGQNQVGHYVYESPAGRFIRLSTENAVVEGSQKAAKLGRPMFLRASNNEELRACAEGFIWKIRQGGKTTWSDLVRFAKIVYDKYTGSEEPSDEQLHSLQEAVEAASYRRFTAVAKQSDETAFKLASDFYYGMPTARMRTAESVFLQQYSTPLPLSVIAQRLLIGNDDTTGKTVIEPTAGNGGLVNLIPETVQIYGVELDSNRFEALRETGRIHAHLGDVTKIALRGVFGVEQGFDYTIANPPFGLMESPRAFDRIPSVRKLDHYIALQVLEARKNMGRSVVIFGADSALSDGTIKGGAKAFLNYIHDHYEVHGLTEVDGRLYSRQGAGYNVRLMIIGNKRPETIQVEMPEKLSIITDYEELWQWAGNVIKCYAVPAPIKKIVEPTVNVNEVDKDEPLFEGSEQTLNSALVEPWKMTLQDWNREISVNLAGSAISDTKRNSSSVVVSQIKRLEYLTYGVTDWAGEKLGAAQRGVVKLTTDELTEITDRLERPVTHRDVIDKALTEGKPVPQEVFADYPDLSAPAERHVNEFQAPYQAASKIGEATSMVPINMAGATYAALNDLESYFGAIDKYVAGKLRYNEEELPYYFSPEQVDAIGLAIKAVEEGRGIINADQTGLGKGRFVAAMLRYAKLNDKMPVFLTIKSELFTDIFRDINDIGSQHLFEKLFIFNDGESVKRFGTESEVLYRATTSQERKEALSRGMVEPGTDMVLATYS